MNRYQQTYQQLTFIETGIEPDGRFEDQARAEAAERGWRFEKVARQLDLFRRLAGRRLGRARLPGRAPGPADRRPLR